MNQQYSDEHMEGEVVQAPDIETLAVLNKSEIDQQITTARKYPRSIVQFRKEALQLATLDEQTASECIYALPRAGKTIEGPSARFAEIINYAWGNTRAGARVVSEDEEFVTSQGLFYDLEKNTAISYEVKRRITDSRGRRYNADMIGTTSNAASSIGLRNAVLKGIPKALWKPIYDSARKVVAGDIRTLANRRDEAIKAFAIFGVTQEQIFATLGVKGVQDITIDHLVVLKGIHTAIQEGDTTPEQAFSQQTVADVNAQKASQATAEELRNKYAKSAEGQTAQDPSPAPEAAQSHPPQESPAPQQNPVETEKSQASTRRGVRRGAEPQGQPLTFTDRSDNREPGQEG
jgi:hypothetical protein